MSALQADFARWELDGRAVRQRMYGAPTARERERWHDGRAPRVGGLLDLGWTTVRVAEALEPGRPHGWRLAGGLPAGRAGEHCLRAERRSPRPQPGATRGIEGGHPGVAGSGRVGGGELELACGRSWSSALASDSREISKPVPASSVVSEASSGLAPLKKQACSWSHSATTDRTTAS
jgi:hypothetical protein